MQRIYWCHIPLTEYCRLGKLNLFPEFGGCPHKICFYNGRLRKHGFYSRSAITLDGIMTVWIQRYICPSCGHTVSALPSSLLPHFQYGISVIDFSTDVIPAPPSTVVADQPLPAPSAIEDMPDETASLPPTEPNGPLIHSRYIGLLLIAPFYHELMAPLLSYIIDQDELFHSPWKQYRMDNMMAVITTFTINGTYCPEQAKSLFPDEYGVVIGKERGPCCKTIRRNLPALARENLADELEERLLQRLIELNYVEIGLVHLDGHFVPYFGRYQVGKGYWPQREVVPKAVEFR